MKPTLGIDLGTTNCAVARAEESGVQVLAIPQLVNPGEVRAEPLYPSSLYLPGPTEFAPGALALPWDDAPPYLTGELAKKRGAENPSRLVHSAKSWLAVAGEMPHLSPLEATRAYLTHLKAATPNFADHDVLITVPASFDAAARDLTLQAARLAGYPTPVLLEEPQAAFYAWLERHPDWRDRIQPGALILVVDIGGGTTDFTLIRVAEAKGELTLERIAVGEHILLGGDNIDLALARAVEAEMPKLDAAQLHALWQRCRVAKEKLLAPGATQAEEPVTILGRGTGLIAGTLKATLRRGTLEQILLEGFLPLATATDTPAKPRRVALQEVGLPYASDPAITRHLAAFLRGQQPTHVLFNGGVLNAPLVRERLLAVLNSWLPAPVEVLSGEDLMHAVARGAAYYGLARQGRGLRIRGGVPRTYYLGIESAMPAVPGLPPPMKALAIVPFGLEEGSSVALPKYEFSLRTGEPAEFRFFSSTTRQADKPGDLLDPIPPEVEELAPMEVTLSGAPARVSLEAQVTETGMLEIYCVATSGER
ncbi:MAG: Hsp70 family protein, partial [Acidobacteria bacterium]|nr:Hsp70 family protein [Acidobacteriota bacterium]